MRSNYQTADQGRQSFIEAARRAQIIECAIDAIAELGFAQASLAQIAKRAGVSTGVISYYFAGKDDLIRAVAAHVYAVGEAHIDPMVSREGSLRVALLSFIEASVDFIAVKPRYPVAIMNIIRAGRAEGGKPRFDPAVGEARRLGFNNILLRGQELGEFRPFNVDVMTITIIESLDCIPQQVVENPDLDLKAYAAELVTLFDRATRYPSIAGD
jgi:TetR/AcrR family fatty acid metabolism transcriptional regulator